MRRLSAKMALAIALTTVAAGAPRAHAVTLDQLQKIQGAQQRGVLAEARRAVAEGRLSDAERLLEQARNMNHNPAEVKEVADLIAAERRSARLAAEREHKEEEQRRAAAAAAQGSGRIPAPSYGGAPSVPYDQNTVTVIFKLATGRLEGATTVTLNRRDAYGIPRGSAGFGDKVTLSFVPGGLYDMDVDLRYFISQDFFGQIGNPLFGSGPQNPAPGSHAARFSFQGITVGCPYLWLTLDFAADNREVKLSGRCG